MKFNNEQTIFQIPSLYSEWIFPAELYYNKEENIFYVVSELMPLKSNCICKFTIFHTFIGDIKRFNITCRDFTTTDSVFEFILEPILRKYCEENLIELKFDYLVI
jgi:hypothetical protein